MAALSSSKSVQGPPVEVLTLTDITSQILSNAVVLYHKEKNLKVVTAQVPSGLIYYCSVLADDAPLPNYPKIPVRPKVILKGTGATSRRAAVMSLLEETEKRVAKEILKLGH